MANYFVMRLLSPGSEPVIPVPYTVFKQQVADGNVRAIYSKGQNIEGQFVVPVTVTSAQPASAGQRVPADAAVTVTNFSTLLPVFVDPGFEAFLIDHNVEIRAVPIDSTNPWATMLFGFGPALLIIGFYVWLYRRASRQMGGMGGMGGIFGMGKSKARRYDHAFP